VTAPAAPRACSTRPCAASRSGSRSRAGALIAALSLAAIAAPAAAETGASLSIYSDERFRGYSLSDGRPVGILDLSYDATGGLYAALSASIVASRAEGIKPLSFTVNGGYAKQLRPGLTGEVGIIHSRYSHYSGLSGRTYTELYAGVSGKVIGSRLSISPDYVGKARGTLHGEVNGHLDLTPKLLVDGAAGLLLPIGAGAYANGAKPQWDARVGVAQRLGPLTLHAAVTTRGIGPDLYSGRRHGRTALVVGVSTAL
jgi:uncharacterized protein (TIGR02001 family)